MTTTANIAANWITTSNISLKEECSALVRKSNIFKCAVDEIGKNSVKPSMIERIMV